MKSEDLKNYSFNNKKIFYIYYHDPEFVPIHVNEVISEMSFRGCEVHLFTALKSKSLINKLSLKNTCLHNIPCFNIKFFAEIVFIFFLFPYFIIKTIIDRPDICYTRHSACSLVPVLIAKLMRISCFIEVNDIVVDKLAFGNVPAIKIFWIKFYQYINYRLASYLLPVTKEIGLWIKSEYKTAFHKIVVVPNGVNVNRFSPQNKMLARQHYNIPQKARVILSLGSLFPWAGIETLIAAAPEIIRNYPNTYFIIGSGEEPYLSQLKLRVNESGLNKNFLFFGFIPWDDASSFISMADICVAPFIFKHLRSGICSLRVLSYLSCGIPVIGSDIPGLGDLLENKKIGRSFHMGDSQSLANNILELLTDKTLHKKMGCNARAYIIEYCSWEAIVTKIGSLIPN
jgi:glycosyltransferase involved in cell wall biosynthesis